jgi:hypothetical protein
MHANGGGRALALEILKKLYHVLKDVNSGAVVSISAGTQQLGCYKLIPTPKKNYSHVNRKTSVSCAFKV